MCMIAKPAHNLYLFKTVVSFITANCADYCYYYFL